MKEERHKLFDAWSLTYDTSLEMSQGFPFAGYETVLHKIVEAASVVEGGTVLDVGTGTGNLAQQFLGRGCEVSACDYSTEMLTRAKTKLRDVRLFELDLTSFTSFASDYDRIVSSYVFHEFDLYKKIELVALLSEQLNENGFLVLGDIAFQTRAAHDATRHTYKKVWDDEEYYWIADEVKPALAAAGFSFSYQQVSSCAAVMSIKRMKE